MRYATAYRLSVRSPERCADFLCQHLGFTRQQQDDAGLWLNNGCLPLLLVPGDEDSPACLQVHCGDVAREARHLLAIDGVSSIDAQPRREGACISQRLDSGLGLHLCLYRVLNEDELGILPPLPANLPWDPATDTMVRRILRIVPVDFRQRARQRVTERAEYLCIEQGEIDVARRHAVQALLDVTLDFQRPTLIEALREEGIEVEDASDKSE